MSLKPYHAARPGKSRPDSVSVPPVFVVHGLGHAVAGLTAAAAAGRPVVLLSAPNAGGYAGPGWFRELADAAREAVPAARFAAYLDCGNEAGSVLAALRAGVEGVVFTGCTDVARRLADIARRHGACLATRRPAPCLDLGDAFFAAPQHLVKCCAEALARAAPSKDETWDQ
jgi:hypothetical protein